MPTYFRTNLTSKLPTVHKAGCPILKSAVEKNTIKRYWYWIELDNDESLIEKIINGYLSPAKLCKKCFDKKEAEALDRWFRGVRYGYEE